jgi:hypothetical protein
VQNDIEIHEIQLAHGIIDARAAELVKIRAHPVHVRRKDHDAPGGKVGRQAQLGVLAVLVLAGSDRDGRRGNLLKRRRDAIVHLVVILPLAFTSMQRRANDKLGLGAGKLGAD